LGVLLEDMGIPLIGTKNKIEIYSLQFIGSILSLAFFAELRIFIGIEEGCPFFL
jgi:hypothetical protein